MKNLIGYFYNIFITEYKKYKSNFYFEIDGKKYSFILFDGDPQKLYDNYMAIKKNNRYCHEIIFNKNNSIVTFYDEKPYVLIKKDICLDKCVDILEITSYDFFVGKNYSLDWKNLWQQKIDYYEYQMSQISSKYPILKKSFSYYVGLTETAISLLNYVDKASINYFICHRRITERETVCDFFNPIEIVIDSRTRDLAEYIKINYIYGNLSMNEIYQYIENFNFNFTDGLLFFIRLIYPSYYFDLYDKLIQGEIGEERLDSIIKKNSDYELFLKNIYKYFKKNYSVPNVEWLNN